MADEIRDLLMQPSTKKAIQEVKISSLRTNSRVHPCMLQKEQLGNLCLTQLLWCMSQFAKGIIPG